LKRWTGESLLAIGAVGLALLFAGHEVSATEPTKVGEALRAASLDGTWSGTTKCLYDPGLWPEDICDTGWNISIDGVSATIEMITKSKSGKETRSRVENRAIFVRRVETNAVLTTIDSGNDKDGHWVETWTFSLSLKDKDHMLVHWNRVVNNTDFPIEKQGSKFSVVEMGELVRTASAKVADKAVGDGPTDASLEELFAVGKVEQLLGTLRVTFAASFRNGVEASLKGKNLSPQKRREIDDLLTGFDQELGRVLNWQTLRPIYVKVYRETFSQEEVDSMIAFYRSPGNRAMMDKMPAAMEKAQIAMKPLLQKLLEEFKAQGDRLKSDASTN